MNFLKKVTAIITAVIIIATACFGVPSSVFATESETYTDTFASWSEFVVKSGSWDLFAKHTDTGLSVAGRSSTTSENYLIYEFDGKAITDISIKVAEFTGLFEENDLLASAYYDNKWNVLSLKRGNETAITGASNQSFKSMNISIDTLAENTSKIKISLANSVAWTLFLDEITFSLKKSDTQTTDDRIRYEDDFVSLDNLSDSTGKWSCFAAHGEFGASVIGRDTTDSENSVIYNFDDGKIEEIQLNIVGYSGFYSSTDVSVFVSEDSESYSKLSMSESSPKNISGYESVSFKSISLSAKEISGNYHSLKIVLSNAVNWTTFLDSVTVFGVSKLKEPIDDRARVTDNADESIGYTSLVGSWNIFPNHSEFGLSVRGRNLVDSDTYIVYKYTSGEIDEVRVGTVVYSGFFVDTDVEISVSKDGTSYSVVDFQKSSEKDIENYESISFKTMILSAKEIPDDSHYLKIQLKNQVNYTLFLDYVTTFGVSDVEKAVVSEVTDQLTENLDDYVDISSYEKSMPNDKYFDDFISIDNPTQKHGKFSIYEKHPEFGLSVVGRGAVDSQNTLVYDFDKEDVKGVKINLVIFKDFFLNSDILIEGSENGTDYVSLDFAKSKKSDIENYETSDFKQLSIITKGVPKNIHIIRISMKNEVAYTMFVDSVGFFGVQKPIKFFNEKKLSYTDCNGTDIEYFINVPTRYDSTKKYPLIFFMHGVGGDTDYSGYEYLRNKIYDNGYECILLAPIANREDGQWWVDYDKLLKNIKPIYNQDEVGETDAFIAAYNLLIDVKEQYSVDSSRVYAMGISMGGFATYEMITRYPESFSAAVSICGGCDPEKATAIKDMPVWFFHGNKDETVSVDASIAVSNQLKLLNSSSYRYTEYDGLDHGIWFEVFDNKELFPWLFGVSRETSGAKIVTTGCEIEGAEIFTDTYENFEKTTLITSGFDLFNPHPETGLSVIGRKNVNEKSSVYYTFDDRIIKKISCILQFVDGLCDIDNELIFEIAADDNDTWKKVPMRIGKSSKINDTFVSKKVVSAVIPDGIHKLKITLKNGVLWGMMLDELNLSLLNDGSKMPQKEWSFIDDLNDGNLLSGYSNNLKFFTPHPETNLNVLAKKNAKKGYISYKLDKCINDLDISLQVAPEFFDLNRDILVQYRLKGKEEYKDLSVLTTTPKKITDSFSLISLVPEYELPDNIEEIKINLYNDVAWTTMIDSVKIGGPSGIHSLKSDVHEIEEIKEVISEETVDNKKKDDIKKSSNETKSESSNEENSNNYLIIILITAIIAVVIGAAVVVAFVLKLKLKNKR